MSMKVHQASADLIPSSSMTDGLKDPRVSPNKAGHASHSEAELPNREGAIHPAQVGSEDITEEVVDELAEDFRKQLYGPDKSISKLKPQREFDLRDCKCADILTQVYPELIRHWKQSGNVERTVHFLIEAGAAAISIDDNLQALKYLEEVQQILVDVEADENPFAADNIGYVDMFEFDPWIKARVESLMGQAKFQMWQVEDAVPHFNKALKILGNMQPVTRAAKHIKIFHEGMLQWHHHRHPSSFLGVIPPLMCHRMIEQARCLSHLFNDFQTKQQKTEALMTVLQQVNRAEEANSDLHELIIAYTCMMECCQMLRWTKICRVYERKAQIRCMKTNQSVEDLLTTGHLYNTSLNIRMCEGLIAKAIEAGLTGDGIIKKLHDNDMRIELLPHLIHVLILANRIQEAVESISQLEYVVVEIDDMLGRGWYYACCMDLILHTGYQVESYTNCLEFAVIAKYDKIFKMDKMPLFFLSSCLALWFQRQSEEEKMNMWQLVAETNVPPNFYNYMSVHGFLNLLECKLLALSKNVFLKNGSKITTISLEIEKDLLALMKYCKYLPVFRPRFHHFHAYYLAIHGKRSKALQLLNMCKKVSNEQGNISELQWSEQSREVWYELKYDELQINFWVNNAVRRGGVLDWHAWKEMEGERVKFSLPLPQWFKLSKM